MTEPWRALLFCVWGDDFICRLDDIYGEPLGVGIWWRVAFFSGGGCPGERAQFWAWEFVALGTHGGEWPGKEPGMKAFRMSAVLV